MSDDFRLDSIGQIHVTVEDLQRAIAFYRDVLGMKFLFEVPGQAMAFFDCGGIRLYLGKAESSQFRSHPLIYYQVDRVEAAFEALQSRGVEFEFKPHVVHRTETHELWMAGFGDGEGNHVQLMSEVAIDQPTDRPR